MSEKRTKCHRSLIGGRHDTQHNDIQHKDTQHKDTQHNDPRQDSRVLLC
jgi:hypothetical protein